MQLRFVPSPYWKVRCNGQSRYWNEWWAFVVVILCRLTHSTTHMDKQSNRLNYTPRLITSHHPLEPFSEILLSSKYSHCFRRLQQMFHRIASYANATSNKHSHCFISLMPAALAHQSTFKLNLTVIHKMRHYYITHKNKCPSLLRARLAITTPALNLVTFISWLQSHSQRPLRSIANPASPAKNTQHRKSNVPCKEHTASQIQRPLFPT